MIYNKRDGRVCKVRGTKLSFSVGDTVMANNCSPYAGLKGEIFEIRTGHEKDTDNSGPDIYVTFERPTEPELIQQLERRFSDLYQNPTTIDELCIDEVIMAADMLNVIARAKKSGGLYCDGKVSKKEAKEG